MQKRLFLIALAICCLSFAAKREITAWHHDSSPYRAVFEVKSVSSIPKVGALIEVPVCGLGAPGGRDVICFDEHGKQLPARSLGSSRENKVLVQTMLNSNSQTVLAYFGSKQNAPSAKFELTPPICKIYTLPEGPINKDYEINTRLKNAELLGQLPIQSLEICANPIDSRGKIIIELDAVINNLRDVNREFFLCLDGSGVLAIDGATLISYSQTNRYATIYGKQRKEIALKPGFHPLKILVANPGNDEDRITAALGLFVNEKRLVLMPPLTYVQGAKLEFQTVETHHKDTACPVFQYSHSSWLALDDMQFTITEFHTLDGKSATWTFGDGVKLQGGKVMRAFGSLDSLTVKVQAGKVTASGLVTFPQIAPPKHLSASNPNDFKAIDELLTEDLLAKCKDADALQAFLSFFMRQDLHPKQALAAKSLLGCKKLKQEQIFAATLALARSSALDSPDKSLHAYEKLLKTPDIKRDEYIGIVQETLDFVMFRMLDFQLAEHTLTKAVQRLPKNSKAVTAMKLDLAMLTERTDEAKLLYDKLLEGKTRAMERRVAAVQGNSLQANVEQLLKDGKILEAETALREWIASSPQDRSNGSYALARARCFRKRGWLDGAAAVLCAAIKMDSLLPNLPEAEFELSEIYAQQGKKQESDDLKRKIVKEYPNHPLARKLGR